MENRFEGAIWAEYIKTLFTTVIGLGATGSFVSFFLARAGVRNFNLVDFDKIELHNCGSQLFPFSDIGLYKTEAVKKMLLSFTDCKHIRAANNRIQEVDWLLHSKNIIISTLDSMEGRKFIFEEFLKGNTSKSILFDPRIGAEYWEVYAVPIEDKDKIERYRATLFDDNKGNTGACNYQQSSHSACGAALKITELTTNWITNQITEDDYLPFKITNDLRTNNYGIHY